MGEWQPKMKMRTIFHAHRANFLNAGETKKPRALKVERARLLTWGFGE